MSPRQERPMLAIALMLFATVFIAGTTLLAKALGTGTFGPPLHALQITQGRFLFAFTLFSTAALVLRPRFSRPNLPLHLARGLVGWAGVTCMFAAVAFIPLSDATAISFLNPVFAMILAIPILGERIGPVRWAAAGIAFAGALILLRPGPQSFQPAALLALMAAVMMAVEVICMKYLSKTEGVWQILLINNAIGLTISSLSLVLVWHPPTAQQWAALAGIGVLMAMAQVCYVNSVARAEASLVVPFSYATLVFAAIYDLVIFDVVPDAISITGAGVIIAGAALLAFREARRAGHSPARDG